MREMALWKQQVRDFNRELNGMSREIITIKYDLEKVNERNSDWEIGDTFSYLEVSALREVISSGGFADNNVANMIIGKNIFKIRYSDYDFSNNEKRNIKVIDENGLLSNIDIVIPWGKNSYLNTYLSWWLIQR